MQYWSIDERGNCGYAQYSPVAGDVAASVRRGRSWIADIA